VLYGLAQPHPSDFARLIIQESAIDLDTGGDWDLGYEVAFYRDYLWPTSQTARQRKYPAKRTFDLCLFGNASMIVIEAKVFERFTRHQNDEFASDAQLVNGIPGLEGIKVRTVALASSKYFTNAAIHAKPEALEVFDGAVSWATLAGSFDDNRLLQRADALYKMRKVDLLAGDPV